MYSSFFRLLIVALFFVVSSAPAIAQTKAVIHIKKNVNGNLVEETREIELTEGQDLNTILRDMGVIDELGQLQPGQEFNINIEKNDKGAFDQNLQLHLNPEELNNLDPWNMPAPEPQAYLGVMLRDESGVVEISEVIEGTAAAKEELEMGDQIVKIDEQEIASIEDVIAYIHSKNPGDEIKLTYKRDGKKKSKKIVLGERVEEWSMNPQGFQGMPPMPPMPGFDYFFSPDSITIVCPDKNLCDSMKICQPFSWNGEGFKNSNTPFLGVTPGEQTEIEGASIGSIIDGSTAQAIGLEVNDVIISLNGVSIKHFDHLKEIISSMEVGNEIVVEVNRGGRNKTLKGILGGKPCSSNEDFRIFHDYQGMDEDGNYYYNFEFDMDEEDLESQMEELLNQITNQEEQLLQEKERIEEQLRALRENNASTYEISIDIMDISNAEVDKVNSNEKTQVTNANDLVFNRISLYPNPGAGVVQLSFELPAAEKFEVSILNSQGSEVHYESYLGMKEYNNTIDLTHHAKGIYYLMIKQNGKAFSKKLIVQ